jgi:hypothetical protein
MTTRRIPISQIIFDTAMFNAIQNYYKKTFTRKNERLINTGFTAPLKRMGQFPKNRKNANVTEPVRLKQDANTGFYKIMNGRHRVVYSLWAGKKNVPAIIVN